MALLAAVSSKDVKKDSVEKVVNQKEKKEQEEKAAFQRDYAIWKEKWKQDSHIPKTYIGFADGTFSGSVGWDKINGFVKKFIGEHPEPELVLDLLDNIDVRMQGNGTWVNYRQQDSLLGLKRETKLMEKVNGEWKIAGMQTTIYGFDTDKYWSRKQTEPK